MKHDEWWRSMAGRDGEQWATGALEREGYGRIWKCRRREVDCEGQWNMGSRKEILDDVGAVSQRRVGYNGQWKSTWKWKGMWLRIKENKKGWDMLGE